MIYCAAADVRVHAPQASSVADADFAPYMADASGIFEANMRSNFKVPLYAGVLGDVDQYVKTLVSKLAAGLYLSAKLSRLNGKVNEYAQSLIDEAMAMIANIKRDLTLISSALVEPGDLDDDLDSVETYGDDHAPVFGFGDERTWG